MRPGSFKLERFFAQYEFSAPHLMCCSDCESLSIGELMALEPGTEQKMHDLWLGYTESQGGIKLREEIATLFNTLNVDQILVHSGAEEAIFSFMNAILNPGDHVIVQFPAYQSLYELPYTLGCEVSKWELKPGQHGWDLNLDELEKCLKVNTRAIIINSPHNPTGYSLSQEKLERIIEIARDNNIIILADEVYKYLEYDQTKRTPWVADLYENAVSLGVMSKSLGLPGLRIGWIGTKNPQIYAAMASFKDYTSICNSAPSEYLARIALKNRGRILKRNFQIIENNLALLDAFFKKYNELFDWYRPDAGPIAFPAFKTTRDADDICEDLVNKKGVLILPASCYDYDTCHFRVGFGRKNFSQSLEKFDDYIVENLL
ncbi:MAG: aminotransferase class I/II-fold pyridoxal phosphate-dependent enzyme [Syntrophomonadaceae bacterium]|nr:aminotransferase class I/II-fold pyridoxal phosphate-dependent enzyme [Syntrophomonadaceae bacterium]